MEHQKFEINFTKSFDIYRIESSQLIIFHLMQSHFSTLDAILNLAYKSYNQGLTLQRGFFC